MEERRAHGFRVRPSYGQVLGYIAEGEPLPISGVRATDGFETFLKHALPVPRGSAELKARLARPPVPLVRPARFQFRACCPALFSCMINKLQAVSCL